MRGPLGCFRDHGGRLALANVGLPNVGWTKTVLTMVVLTMVVLAQVSCGDSHQRSRNQMDGFVQDELQAQVQMLPSDRESCQHPQPMAMQLLPAIAEVQQDHRSTMTSTIQVSGDDRRELVQVVNDYVVDQPGKRMISCGQNGILEGEAKTLQEVALKVGHSITAAHAFYRSLDLGQSLDLDAVDLAVLPRLRQITSVNLYGETQEERGFITNNASYGTWENDKGVISFFPQGGSDIELMVRAPFWEKGFVAQHEYGHHIFRSWLPRLFADTDSGVAARHRDPAAQVTERRLDPAKAMVQSQRLQEGGNGELITLADGVSAVNEGFADLFAFYSHNESWSYDDVPRGCFGKTRQVNRSVWQGSDNLWDTDLTPVHKTLDADFLAGFLYGDDEPVAGTDDTSYSCPVYKSDPHAVGAVYAAAFHALISHLDGKGPFSRPGYRYGGVDGVTNIKSKAQEKADAALDWLQRMDAAYEPGALGPKGFLELGYAKMVEAIEAAQGQQLVPAQKVIAREFFPEFVASWSDGSQS